MDVFQPNIVIYITFMDNFYPHCIIRIFIHTMTFLKSVYINVTAISINGLRQFGVTTQTFKERNEMIIPITYLCSNV